MAVALTDHIMCHEQAYNRRRVGAARSPAGEQTLFLSPPLHKAGLGWACPESFLIGALPIAPLQEKRRGMAWVKVHVSLLQDPVLAQVAANISSLDKVGCLTGRACVHITYSINAKISF